MIHPDTLRLRLQVSWLGMLFFLWGAITSLNDIILPHMKSSLDLTYVQAMLIQFSFFAAYLVASLPSGVLIGWVGRRVGIAIGLLVACAGSLLCAIGAYTNIYAVYLLALFILACGIVILQVAGNASITLLGEPHTATRRLVLTQAFNALGAAVMPYLSAAIFLPADPIHFGNRIIASIPLLYIGIAMVLIVAALSANVVPWATEQHVPHNAPTVPPRLRNSPQLWFGATALFLYVGAEVAISSLLASYLQLVSPGSSITAAGTFVSLYWAGALIGRFVGALLMRHIHPSRLLAFNAMVNCALIASAVINPSPSSIYELTAIGLFNAIMFPTIFAMALQGLGAATDRASGMLCMAVVGGAVIPLLQAGLADHLGLVNSFIIPLLCYLFILGYGMMESGIRRLESIWNVRT